MSIYCHICKKAPEDKFKSLSAHVRWVHNIPLEEYYNAFLKKSTDGTCIVCLTGVTHYLHFGHGYRKTCGYKCGAELRSRELMEASGLTNVSQILDVKNKKASTCIKKYGHVSHLMNDKIKRGIKKACIRKYGVDNPSKNEAVKQRRKQTILEKYGKDSYAKTLTFRQAQEALGKWTPIEHKSDLEIYRMLVWAETKKWKKKLFEMWDGTCAYTKKMLLSDKESFNDPLYATIDHKVSIVSGFKAAIDPTEIGHISNLCICSRSANSAKKTLSVKKFIELLGSMM